MQRPWGIRPVCLNEPLSARIVGVEAPGTRDTDTTTSELARRSRLG